MHECKFLGFQKWSKSFIQCANKNDLTTLSSGFFIGDDSNLNEITKQLFKNLGLTHLLSASGSNCMIVAQSFFILSIFLLNFFSKPSNKTQIKIKLYFLPATLILGAWIFYFWSKKEIPILRAAIMTTTHSVLKIMQIKYSLFRSLFFHAIIFLLCDYKNFNNLSFLLSFFCLFGVLVGLKTFEKIAHIFPLFLRNFCEFLFINLGASFGASIITAIYFKEINLTGIVSNLYAVPIVSFLIMPLCLIAMLFLPLNSNLSALILYTTGLININLVKLMFFVYNQIGVFKFNL
jgi:competence protein ComEC